MEVYNSNSQNDKYNWGEIEKISIEEQRRKLGNQAIHAMRGFENNPKKVLGEIQSKSEIFQEGLLDEEADKNSDFDFNQFFDEGEIKPEFGNLEQILELNE